MSHRRAGAYRRHRLDLAKRRGYLDAPASNDHAPTLRSGQRLYRANLRYGLDLEHRAVEAFATGELPDWYVSIRPATPAEDAAGIDVWVNTDRGPVPVQVKSSAARAALFREQHPGMEIAVVVLHIEMTDERIRERVLAGVERLWSHRGRRAA